MNSISTRQAFSSQNGQCLIIDTADINIQFLNNVIKAAQDVLAIACSVRGGIRIPAFSLSVLTKGVTELFELETIRGNFNQISSALNGVSSYCEINVEFNPQDYKDSLYHAIHSIIRSHSMKQSKNEDFNNIAQIEITFVTMRDSQILKSFIETIIQGMEISTIFKIAIIELKYVEHDIIENKHGLIHTIILNGADHSQILKYFKSWLLDQTTEIGAILYLPGPEPHLAIKCDISECIINPLSLPFGHRLYPQLDSLSIQMTGISVAKTASSDIPVHEINILARVPLEEICESALFGLPLCLKPTKSWRLSVDDEKANEEYFLTLCKHLSECGQFLLAKIKSLLQTDHLCPYFALIPGDGRILMKSFATSDVTLPWKQEDPTKEISVENCLPVWKNLQNLKLIANLDSNMYDCGLFAALKANLKHAKRDSDFDVNDLLPSKRSKRSK